jgi:hypothetical protein
MCNRFETAAFCQIFPDNTFQPIECPFASKPRKSSNRPAPRIGDTVKPRALESSFERHTFSTSVQPKGKSCRSGVVRGNPETFHQELVRFVARHSIVIAYSRDIAPARGVSRGRATFPIAATSITQAFGSAWHEFGQKTMRVIISKRCAAKRSGQSANFNRRYDGHGAQTVVTRSALSV